ncbi:MAG: OsmC family peroxiredoxin [Myxococcaceae bacterium]
MAAIRRARVVWEGDLRSGRGLVDAATTGVFKQLPVTWGSRIEAPEGRTSPEELIAAAHASCFSMALAGELGRGGTPPQKLEVSAAVTFGETSGGYRILSSSLEVRGVVPGLDSAGFTRAAEAAGGGCPVSQALKGNVKLEVRATLAG